MEVKTNQWSTSTGLLSNVDLWVRLVDLLERAGTGANIGSGGQVTEH